MQKVLNWLGVAAPIEQRNVAARRNMLILAFGGLFAALFGGMISVCMVFGLPCPVEGLDEAMAASPEKANRYKVFCPVVTLLLVLVSVYASIYLRTKRCHPRGASFVAMLFSLLAVMLWGVAASGRNLGDQLLIYSSIQFLIAGLIVFSPFFSLGYFSFSSSLFAIMLDAVGSLNAHVAGEVTYLFTMDVVISWVVYSLHRRGVLHEIRVADMSRRDELTGAKNRHYLRDDFPTFVGNKVFIMLCDIDNFKHFNDAYDHSVGDALLKDFYYALYEVFGDECTYRYGGDEFLVVTPDFDEGDFQRKAARVTGQLELVTIGDSPAGLTFSGGYVWGISDSETDYRLMLHAADANLLKAKQSGKNRLVGLPYTR